jgi:hypothetical protein
VETRAEFDEVLRQANRQGEARTSEWLGALGRQKNDPPPGGYLCGLAMARAVLTAGILIALAIREMWPASDEAKRGREGASPARETEGPEAQQGDNVRNLTDHIVEGDSANHQLQIQVQDGPGRGGACHRYVIGGFNTSTNESSLPIVEQELLVLFQNGPIAQFGVNGVTQEALLAIVIDRLRCFQKGPYMCRENAIALTHCEEALMWLQRRTRARIARGVEGTHEK